MSSAPPTPEPQGATARSRRSSTNAVVWHMVRKYWPTALATALAVVIGVTFYTLGQKKIYEAEGTVMFNPNPPRPLGRRVEEVVDLGAGQYWNNQEYYETQYRIIQSRHIAMTVVRSLGLQNDGAFIQNLAPNQPAPAISVEPEIAAEILRGRLRVQPVKDSRLATVKLQDADPERAQRLLSIVIDTYVSENLESALESTNSANDWLRGQLDKLKTDLESSEMSLHDYKKDKDILSVAFNDQSNMLREKMVQISTELTRVRGLQQAAAARKAEIDKVETDDPTRITNSELLQSAVLTGLRQQLADEERVRDGLIGEGKGANHPLVQASSRRIARTRDFMVREIHNVKAATASDLAVLNRRAGGLAGDLAVAKKEALELNLLEIEYNRLARSKENTEKLYSLVLERTKESDLTRMLRVNNIRVLDRPLLPGAPVYPRVPLNIAAGLFAGLLLGVVASFVRGLLDRTIKVPDDLEHELGVTFLGLLPQLEKGGRDPMAVKRRRRGRPVPSTEKPELIVHEQPKGAIAEAARAIRTNLMFMAPDNPYKTLLVTSAGPREGKTTVACCIAVAMAQAGQSVVLVDCDLRRPRVHRIFGTGSEGGVTTALLDARYDEVISESEVPNLHIMPCGPVPPNPAELFHSDRFRKLLAHLQGRFDRVIIDSPPIVAVTDATILSTLVDGTVVVARAFQTRKELGRHALRSIHDVGGKVAGAVLNAVDFSRMEYKYSYYYYRRDSYYGPEGAPASSRSSRPSEDREQANL